MSEDSCIPAGLIREVTLVRKDSALAEVVAILTLKKKLDSKHWNTDEAE